MEAKKATTKKTTTLRITEEQNAEMKKLLREIKEKTGKKRQRLSWPR